LLIPLLGGLLILLLRNHPQLREASSIVTGVCLFLYIVQLMRFFDQGMTTTHVMFHIAPGLSIAFHLEPLGLLFALLASGLWIITTIYSIGYMRGNGEGNQTRFYFFFALSIAATMAIALAANLITLFIFYEMLTLCTFPLVAHKQNADAQSGGRTYLGILLGTSILFFLTAIVITWLQTSSLDFVTGGILKGNVGAPGAVLLLTLFMFGLGNAALMPFDRWLPADMVAPTPVSALLHAVAVVKAGVFAVLKISVYVFGIDFIATQHAADWCGLYSDQVRPHKPVERTGETDALYVFRLSDCNHQSDRAAAPDWKLEQMVFDRRKHQRTKLRGTGCLYPGCAAQLRLSDADCTASLFQAA